MVSKLSDAVVVITGASSGMGRAAAHRFAEEGAKLVLTARRQNLLEQAAEECRDRGAQALVVPADVTRFEQVQAVASRTIDRFGRIDVWINNAGVLAMGRFDDIPPADFERVIQVNLFGCVNGARVAIPHFRQRGRGVLINNASVVAAAGQPLSAPYVASKWAVRGFSDALRTDLLDQPGIHVCTLMPGPIDTPLFQHAANFTGRGIRAPVPAFSPRRAAEVMVALAKRPRAEMSVAAPARLAGVMHTLAPATIERRLARVATKALLSDRSVEPTHGNLFQTMQEGDSVTGGWQSHPTGAGKAGKVVLGGLAILALPAAAYGWQRWRGRDLAPAPR